MTIIGIAYDGKDIFAFSDSIVTRQDKGQYIDTFHQGVPRVHSPTTGFKFDNHYQKLYIFDKHYLVMVAGDFNSAKNLVINYDLIISNSSNEDRYENIIKYLESINPEDGVEYISVFPKYTLNEERYFTVHSNSKEKISNEEGAMILGGTGSELLKLFFVSDKKGAEKFGISSSEYFNDHPYAIKILNLLITFQAIGIDYSNFRFGGWYETAYFDGEKDCWCKIKYSISIYDIYNEQLSLVYHCRVIPHEESTMFLNFFPGKLKKKGWKRNNFFNTKSFLRESPVQLEYEIESIFNEGPFFEFGILIGKDVEITLCSHSVFESSTGTLGEKDFSINTNQKVLELIRKRYREKGFAVGDHLYMYVPDD